MTESTSKKSAPATEAIPPLLFNDNVKSYVYRDWALPEVPLPGMVGCFGADRVDSWDMFVVTSYDDATHMITAICPRLRVDDTDGVSVKVGVDKMTETYEHPAKCTCPPTSQGDDFGCECGAYDAIRKHYALTFAEAEAGGSYKTMEFEHVRSSKKISYVFLEWMYKSEVNDMDYPMLVYGSRI